MHYAVSHGNFDVVSILLDSKVCNVNQTNNAGYTCVMLVSLAQLTLTAHHTVVKRLFLMSDVNIRAKKVIFNFKFNLVKKLLSNLFFLALSNCSYAGRFTWKFRYGTYVTRCWSRHKYSR